MSAVTSGSNYPDETTPVEDLPDDARAALDAHAASDDQSVVAGKWGARDDERVPSGTVGLVNSDGERFTVAAHTASVETPVKRPTVEGDEGGESR